MVVDERQATGGRRRSARSFGRARFLGYTPLAKHKLLPTDHQTAGYAHYYVDRKLVATGKHIADARDTVNVLGKEEKMRKCS